MTTPFQPDESSKAVLARCGLTFESMPGILKRFGITKREEVATPIQLAKLDEKVIEYRRLHGLTIKRMAQIEFTTETEVRKWEMGLPSSATPSLRDVPVGHWGTPSELVRKQILKNQ